MCWQKIIFSSWIHHFSKWWTSSFKYKYVFTHTYGTFLTKKDQKDKKQTYYSAKDPRNFLNRPVRNYARGQWSGLETVRTPGTSRKTFPCVQKCREAKNKAALKRQGFTWIQHVKESEPRMGWSTWWTEEQERKGIGLRYLWCKPLCVSSSDCCQMHMGSDDLIYAEKVF